MAAQVTVDYDIETDEEQITEEQLEHGKMVRTDAGKEAIQNEWQLDTEVWAGDIAGKYYMKNRECWGLNKECAPLDRTL